MPSFFPLIFERSKFEPISSETILWSIDWREKMRSIAKLALQRKWNKKPFIFLTISFESMKSYKFFSKKDTKEKVNDT